MTTSHRHHRNQRLREEVLSIICPLADGTIIRTAELATRLGRGKAEPSSRAIGRMIAELCPELVVPAGTGHWVRRVRVPV